MEELENADRRHCWLSFCSSRFSEAASSGGGGGTGGGGVRLARQASMPMRSFLPASSGSDQQSAKPARPVMRSATSAKETILAWVQQQVNHYDVSIQIGIVLRTQSQ